ncbi:ABC transporter permease [Sporomusa sp.]|uniref:ABC transporter permease n=1 Tax=Sporomusa sp. TaxID=2078658 RepID=UPI002C45A641|nr:ABC transporter permease [Sporomusa sp.]HWR05316.1 ABC transporter permease [Sporomusa sp.]
MSNCLKRMADKCIDISGIIILLLIWEFAPRLELVDRQFFPPFSQVLSHLGKLAADGILFIHIASSLQRIFLGLALAVSLAVPAGIVLAGAFPFLLCKLMPLFRLLEQVNVLALSMIFILFFGIGESVKVFIIFWSTIWLILFATISGVKNVNPLHIKIARSLGAGRIAILKKVILPEAAPVILTGIRSGASYAFFILVVAESMGAYYGVGRLIRGSAFGACIVIAVLGMTINYLFHKLEEFLLEWQRGSGWAD